MKAKYFSTDAVATSSNPRCTPPIAKGDMLRSLPMADSKQEAIEATSFFWQWAYGVIVKDVKVV